MASPLNNMPGTLSVYTPTMRERVVNWFAQNWYGDTREGYDQANKLMNVLDLTPVGAGADIYDAGRAVGRGDYATAGLTAVMAGLPGPTPKGVRAFHGSPHSFDKFSTSKIGTGEGAQAYGHGLYFAENEGVARGYKETLSKGANVSDQEHMTAQRYIQMAGGDREEAISMLHSLNDETDPSVQKIVDYIRNPPGSMYEVNIAANPEDFIDFDKPMGQQPNVTSKLNGWNFIVSNWEKNKIGPDPRTLTGAQWLARNTKNAAKTSENLRDVGIPGIRYLDAGSRVSPAMAAKELADWKAQLPIAEQELTDAIKRNDKWLIGRKQAEVQRVKDGLAQATKGAEGTRNYVVFDDKLISIVRKYGIAGASAMLGYNLLENVSEAQAEELRQIEKGAK